MHISYAGVQSLEYNYELSSLASLRQGKHQFKKEQYTSSQHWELKTF